jgi:hypothetical protein
MACKAKKKLNLQINYNIIIKNSIFLIEYYNHLHEKRPICLRKYTSILSFAKNFIYYLLFLSYKKIIMKIEEINKKIFSSNNSLIKLNEILQI